MGEPELDEGAAFSAHLRQNADSRTADSGRGCGRDGGGNFTRRPQDEPGADPDSPWPRRGIDDAAAPGVWRVEAGGRVAFAAAGQDNPLEFADLRATADKIGPLAHATGGGVIWLGATGAPRLVLVGDGQNAAGPGWIGLRRRDAHLVTGVETVPLLPPWAALPLLLGLALAAWRREAR